MKEEVSVGVIIFKKIRKIITYLIIKHSKGHWAFPKGHRESGERIVDTALRELYEETGINQVDLISKKIMLKEQYTIVKKNGEHTLKTVKYLIAKTAQKYVKIDGNEVVDYRWCPFNEALELITFPEAKEVLKKAHKLITQIPYEKK